MEPCSDAPIDCRSELEHLLLSADCFDLQPTNLYQSTICSNHRRTLHSVRTRRDNCQLCISVFHRSRRATTSLQRITKSLAFQIWSTRRVNMLALILIIYSTQFSFFVARYNGWACTQCRESVAAEFDINHVLRKDPLEWLYDPNIVHTPTTTISLFSHQDCNYAPTDVDTPSSTNIHGKVELKDWLASSNYAGRWRSTDNYSALSSHDQKTFRTQMKAIFLHVLQQLAPNDADLVWEDLIDQETEKTTKTKCGYEIEHSSNDDEDRFYRLSDILRLAITKLSWFL